INYGPRIELMRKVSNFLKKPMLQLKCTSMALAGCTLVTLMLCWSVQTGIQNARRTIPVTGYEARAVFALLQSADTLQGDLKATIKQGKDWIGFAIQKGLAAQLVARLPFIQV
ncbi:mutS2 protein-like, partial [Trifolium medium]|nr:mutS2 protein-like [Trifolium medium]